MEFDLPFWISVVEIPAFGFMVLWIMRIRANSDERHEKRQTEIAAVLAELNAYKLQVAREYATTGFLKDVESRIGKRLDEIAEGIKELRGRREHNQ